MVFYVIEACLTNRKNVYFLTDLKIHFSLAKQTSHINIFFLPEFFAYNQITPNCLSIKEVVFLHIFNTFSDKKHPLMLHNQWMMSAWLRPSFIYRLCYIYLVSLQNTPVS